MERRRSALAVLDAALYEFLHAAWDPIEHRLSQLLSWLLRSRPREAIHMPECHHLTAVVRNGDRYVSFCHCGWDTTGLFGLDTAERAIEAHEAHVATGRAGR